MFMHCIRFKKIEIGEVQVMNYIYFGACDWLSADQHIFILID